MKNLRSSKAKRGARKMSWLPGRKGQGPETGERSKPRDGAELQEKINRDEDYSPSLPSREKIARVLR
jgi:hypothetical protein